MSERTHLPSNPNYSQPAGCAMGLLALAGLGVVGGVTAIASNLGIGPFAAATDGPPRSASQTSMPFIEGLLQPPVHLQMGCATIELQAAAKDLNLAPAGTMQILQFSGGRVDLPPSDAVAENLSVTCFPAYQPRSDTSAAVAFQHLTVRNGADIPFPDGESRAEFRSMDSSGPIAIQHRGDSFRIELENPAQASATLLIRFAQDK